MGLNEFQKQLEHDQIVAALKRAAEKTSGDIRVLVSHRKVRDPMAAAQKEFVRGRMHQAVQRHGVLIYVAPRSRNFAVIGDQGVHARCGDDFWRTIADAMSGYLKQNQPTQAILHAIDRAAEVLAEHFPKK